MIAFAHLPVLQATRAMIALQHLPSFLPVPGALTCRVCGTTWHTKEEWAKDTGACPGSLR